MNTTRVSLQNVGIPTVFFFYFLFVYFLTVGQITDTSMLSQIIGSPVQAYSNNETSNAVLGTQDDQYETRLLAQFEEPLPTAPFEEADTGAGEDGVHYVCPEDRVDNQCEYVGPEGLQQASSSVQDGDIIELRRGVYNGELDLSFSGKDNIILRGEGEKTETIINGSVKVRRGGKISINNITFQEGQGLDGIHLTSIDEIVFENNIIQDSRANGLTIGSYVQKSIVKSNVISRNEDFGITTRAGYSLSNIFIEDNVIENNQTAGIYFENIVDSVVEVNRLTNNGLDNPISQHNNIIANKTNNVQFINNICTPEDPDCNTIGGAPREDPRAPDNDQGTSEYQQDGSICSSLEGKYTRSVFNNYAQTHHGGSPCW